MGTPAEQVIHRHAVNLMKWCHDQGELPAGVTDCELVDRSRRFSVRISIRSFQPGVGLEWMDKPVYEAILNKAPAPGATPMTAKALARVCGYGYNGHFQSAVRHLVDIGHLVRLTSGLRRV